MLRPPYTHYNRLYTYHLDLKDIPAIDDPDLIGTWIEDDTAILFFHRPKERLVQKLCEASGATIIYEADLDYTDWEAGREISTFTLDGFTVAPVWEKGATDISLDPSVIFGSGFHPSTHLCLEGLLKYARSPEISINTALDLGCGTGLLAISAAKQGVGRIIACDNNRLACQVARANCETNGVAGQVTVREKDLRRQCPDTRVDLVMANLYKGLMLELFGNPDFWQAKLYLLSGFISGMEEELLAALPQEGITFLERRRNDRWCSWALLRQ
jgi:ribosomal protein L11 methyltransferase